LYKVLISFLKLFRKRNFRTLFFALKNEPLLLVVKNFKNLIKDTFGGETNRNKSVSQFIKEVESYIEQFSKTGKKEFLIFVSHEASVTGAPLIVLNIAKHIKLSGNAVPLFICLQGGDLLSDFKQVAPTYVVTNGLSWVNVYNETVEIIKQINKQVKISKAIVNSAESIDILKPLKKSNIEEIIYLIHETGSFYKKNAWEEINQYASKIIFPSQFVKAHALENTNFNKNKIYIKGQGLLKPELMSINKQKARIKLRKILNLPEDAHIILGCGQLIARKGFDLFNLTAISVCNIVDNAFFIWLGAADFNDLQKWVDIDLLLSEKKEQIIFAGQVKDVGTYFAGSDVFFLSSRGDPFPCVVQEAMACALPVVGFKNAGGVTELVNDENGVIVNYGDIASVTNSIIKLIYDEKERLRKGKASKVRLLKSFTFKNYVDFIWGLFDEK